jgi:hypothetical protein
MLHVLDDVDMSLKTPVAPALQACDSLYSVLEQRRGLLNALSRAHEPVAASASTALQVCSLRIVDVIVRGQLLRSCSEIYVPDAFRLANWGAGAINRFTLGRLQMRKPHQMPDSQEQLWPGRRPKPREKCVCTHTVHAF